MVYIQFVGSQGVHVFALISENQVLRTTVTYPISGRTSVSAILVDAGWTDPRIAAVLEGLAYLSLKTVETTSVVRVTLVI